MRARGGVLCPVIAEERRGRWMCVKLLRDNKKSGVTLQAPQGWEPWPYP
jgi:hypothetical protein